MKWIGERTSFVAKKESISFVIYPPKVGMKKHLISVWLLLWLLIGVYFSFRLFGDYSRDEKLMLIVILSFWLYYAIRVAKTALYLYFGKELIRVDQTSLRIKMATGRYGKSRQFFLENIAKLRTVHIKDNSFQKVYENSAWVKGSNRIEFEYFGKKYGFGKKLDEKDAEMVHKVLTKRIDKFIRANKKAQ